MAELADALDSKSSPAHPGCGFNSHLQHKFIPTNKRRTATNHGTGLKFRFLLFLLLASAFPRITAAAQGNRVLLFDDDFTTYRNGSDGSPTWTTVKGNWQIVDGRYIQQSSEYDCASMLDLYLGESFEFSFSFEQLDGDPGAGFIFGSREHRDIANAHMARFDGSGVFLAGYFQGGEFNASTSTNTPAIRQRTRHVLTLRVDGSLNRYSVLLDSAFIIENVILRFPAGYVGVQSAGGRVQFMHVTIRRLPTSTHAAAFPWIHHIASSGERLFIPDEHEALIHVVDRAGKRIRTIGTPARAHGQLHEPGGLTLLHDSLLIVTDRGSNQIHTFSTGGRWLQSAGWKGRDRGQFDDPVAVVSDRNGRLFVLERNNHRVQVFDDSLRPVAEFGNDRLVDPLDLAVRDSNIFVVNTGISVVEWFVWNGKHALWKKSISYGGGEGRGIAVSDSLIYLSVVNDVRAYDTTGRLRHTLKGRCVNFIFPQGLVIDAGGRVMIADDFFGRMIETTADLLDPAPSIAYDDSGSASIRWTSVESAPGVVFASDPPNSFFRHAEREATDRHMIRLTNLPSSRTMAFHFSPSLRVIPSMPPEDMPRYTLTTPASRGVAQFRRLPMMALIFANVHDGTNGRLTSLAQPLLPDSEIDRIKRQLSDAVQFYWIHSGMKLFLDLDFIVVRDSLDRRDVYGSESWYPPKESVLTHYLVQNGKRIGDYTGYLFLTCTQRYDTSAKRFVLAGKGGAFTNGVGTGKGYGISWWDVTQANHNAGNNWLMVHEFNHQLDDVFLMSGYPEYWFNHISPTIGTAATFGEHFDANAYILHIVPEEEWLDLRYTRRDSSRDMDGDGIPDNDPRLPLDEARLGSDSTMKDTDGDGVSDFDELRFSNWIIEGWGETRSAATCYPNLHATDTDGDGLTDNVDPYPCSPVVPIIHRRTAANPWHFLGTIDDPRVRCTMNAAWDTDSLYLRFEVDRSATLKLMIDGNADGWFSGRDNVLAVISPSETSETVSQRLQLFNGSDPVKWPFMDEALAHDLHCHCSIRKRNTGFDLDCSIARSEQVGMEFSDGVSLGLSIGLLVPVDRSGNKRYIVLFEPNRLMSFTLRD